MAKKKIEIVIGAIDRATAPVRRINKAIGRMKRPIQRLRFQFRALARDSGLAKLATRMKRFAIVGVAALGGLGFAMKKFIGTADSIAKVAGSLGIATDAWQELSFAAERSGVDASTFASSMKALTKRLGEAKAGSGALVTLLEKTNPALLASLKATSSTEEAFGLLADATAALDDPMKRAALTSAAFSRAGLGMTNVLKLGSRGVDELRMAARNLGLVMDEETLKAAEETQDRFTDLGAVLKGVAFRIGGALLPVVRDITASILAWTRENRTFLSQDLPNHFKAVANALRFVWNIARATVGGIASLVDILGGLRTIGIIVAGVIVGKLIFALLAAIPVILSFGAALLANPLGLVLVAITALAAGISFLIAKWEPAAVFFENLFEKIKAVTGFKLPSFGFGSAEPVTPPGTPSAEEVASGAPAATSDPFGLGEGGKTRATESTRDRRGALHELRAFLRIEIDSEGRASVKRLGVDDPSFEIAVDSGPVMAGM